MHGWEENLIGPDHPILPVHHKVFKMWVIQTGEQEVQLHLGKAINPPEWEMWDLMHWPALLVETSSVISVPLHRDGFEMERTPEIAGIGLARFPRDALPRHHKAGS